MELLLHFLLPLALAAPSKKCKGTSVSSTVISKLPSSTATSLPTYSQFPVTSIPCYTTPHVPFETAQANRAISSVCLPPAGGTTLQAGKQTAYSGVNGPATAVVQLVNSPRCSPGPVQLDAERCLIAFGSFERQCPRYGGQYVLDIGLGCLRISLEGN